MFLNLLAKEIDSPMFDKKIGVGEVAIDALIGFIVVFIGIALLVAIVWAVGKVMQSAGDAKGKTTEKQTKKTETKAEIPAVKNAATDDLDEETIAVISAAIAAYYASEQRSCGFVVKRIKRM